MALPELDKLTSAQILELDRLKRNLISLHRHMEGMPAGTPDTPYELIWLSNLAFRVAAIKKVLDESDPYDLLELWAKHTGLKARRGQPSILEPLYQLAFTYMQTTGETKMEVYHRIVLPVLIDMGRLTLADVNEPDDGARQKATKAQKAMRAYLEAIRQIERKR